MNRLILTFVLILIVAPVAVRAQIPCETKAYFDPMAQERVYLKNLPTPWWGVKMSVDWTATIDTAVISFGITKSAGSGPDTLDVRILKDTLPKFYVLDQMTLGLAVDLTGNVPDAQYIIEFSFQQPVGWVDPPGNFWLSWRLRGPASDVGRTFMRTPAINPTRSVVINANGTTDLATNYVKPQINDSVDLSVEAHVCYPYGMPVELQNFSVAYRNGMAQLNWTTATETGNYGFQIERLAGRSGAVSVWQKIGFVQGHGTTMELQRYSWTDPHPDLAMDEAGVVRYRLRQVDYDGTSDLSSVAELFIPSSVRGFVLDQNYPNPVKNDGSGTMIGFSMAAPGHVQIVLHDAVGREVSVVTSGEFAVGYHSVPFLPRLPAGVYFYTLTAGDLRLTRRMTIVE